MRQIGVLCAAALVGVQENVKKLEEDHKKAKILAGVRFCVPFCHCDPLLLSMMNSIQQLLSFDHSLFS